MDELLTRKEFFKDAAKYAAGATVGIAGMSVLSSKESFANGSVSWPLPYQKLDPEEVRQLGHDTYYAGGCGYAGFHAIIKPLQDLVGSPFTEIPTDLGRYGGGGVAGWGTVCGALNGTAAAICLCSTSQSAIISELMGWYTQELFPTDLSNVMSHGDITGPLHQSACGSPLCHASVATWCLEAGFSASSSERKERCARLAGDTAAKAAMLLNDDYDNNFHAEYVAPASVGTCMACHSSGMAGAPFATGKMECTQCHGELPIPHSETTSVGGEQGIVPYGFKITQNYPNPFNPETTISYEIDRSSAASIKIYSILGKEVRTLFNGPGIPGSYTIKWDGRDNNGVAAASGVYIVRLRSGKRITSSRMTLLK